MSGNRQLKDAQRLADVRSNGGVCDKMLVGLVLYTLVRAGDAGAGEQAPIPGAGAGARAAPELSESRQLSSANASALPLPETFEARVAPDVKLYSATEFRPRGHSIDDTEALESGAVENPTLRNTTVWQRMADYRSHDRVRVLTLWESGASTVSLQAGKRGNPSLQWNSRLMSRGDATRGLLDRLLSMSLAGLGNGPRGAVRSASGPASAAAAKQANPSAAGGAMGNALSAAARDH